jgi:hypothetical protein
MSYTSDAPQAPAGQPFAPGARYPNPSWMQRLAQCARSGLAIGLLAATASVTASSPAPLPERLIASLSLCDGSFFPMLMAHRDELQAQAPVEPRARSGTWPVENVADPEESRVFFSTPLKIGGLDIIGYFDEVIALPDGIAVSWGFMLATSLPEAEATLRPLLWDASRLRPDEGYFVRSEIWRHAQPQAGWSKEATESGLPKPGTVERVFLIETVEGDASFVRAGCSLQGSVSRGLLRQIRPEFPIPLD